MTSEDYNTLGEIRQRVAARLYKRRYYPAVSPKQRKKQAPSALDDNEALLEIIDKMAEENKKLWEQLDR